MRFPAFVAGVSLALSVTGCGGKRVATSFEEMVERAPAGTTVFVTAADGSETTGTLRSVSGRSMQVVLRDASTRDFSEAQVTRIRAKDPLWNGLLIGSALGGFFSFVLNDASCIEPYASSDCQRVSRGASVAIGTGIGGALGAAFDARRHRPLFRAPEAGRASLLVAPVFTPDRAAVLVALRF
jgi:small nuclear ribonucleoprotein (snRNP)-like protein